MKLDPAEKQALLAALLAAFPNRGKLELLLAFPPVGRAMNTLTSPQLTIDLQYFQVIEAADGWWMETLLQALTEGDGVSPELAALAAGFARRRAPVPGLPPHRELLLDGAPFVNHEQLRVALHLMTQAGGARVMQITGDPVSGKSYSQHLIAHVGRRTGAEVYLFPALDAATTARHIVEDLAWHLGFGAPPLMPDAPQDATEVKRLVSWLAAASRRLDRDWWLIFDGFDAPQVDDTVVMLLTGLAQQVGLGQPERIRLFLLAWTRPISGPPPGRIFDQQLTAIDAAQVRAFLDAIVGQFRMPEGFASTDDLLQACYAGWDEAQSPMHRAVTLTQRLAKVAEAARIAALSGDQP